MINYKIKIFHAISFFPFFAFAQIDTLKINIKEAEELFLKHNFSLIAQKYNVDAIKALTKQAKLWDNPDLSTSQNVYDGTDRLFNHADGKGEIYFQIQQVFRTARKRGKQIQLAKDNEQIQQAAFDYLMRNLKYNITLDFYQLNNLIEQQKIHQNEIDATSGLLKSMEALYQAGNISLKENIRIQTLLFSLRSDKQEIINKITDLQTDLQTSLGINGLVFIKPSDIQAAPANLDFDLHDLFEKAKASRADYLSEKIQFQSANHNLSLQKALAIPDVSVGFFYDKANSYAPNYWGLGIEFPLPFFNRNQGNIKAAKLNIKSEEAQLNGLELQIKAQIFNALQDYKQAHEFNTTNEQEFYSKHDGLFLNMLKSYQQRQISLIEFLDFFESYKDVKLKILEQQFNMHHAIAEINYAVGTSIIQ